MKIERDRNKKATPGYSYSRNKICERRMREGGGKTVPISKVIGVNEFYRSTKTLPNKQPYIIKIQHFLKFYLFFVPGSTSGVNHCRTHDTCPRRSARERTFARAYRSRRFWCWTTSRDTTPRFTGVEWTSIASSRGACVTTSQS